MSICYKNKICSSLTSVTIPNSVTSIGRYAFAGCHSITSVTIPNSVTSISKYAFSSCFSLTSVTIPNSVTSIGNHAFENCSSLTSVTIPNSVTSIGISAFSGCYFTIDNFINNSSLDAKSNNYWGATICDEIDGLCIVAGVLRKYRGEGTSVTIPNSVTSIGQYAFENCSSLTSVTIPNSVVSLGNESFKGCVNLEEVYVEWQRPLLVGSVSSTSFSKNDKGFILSTLYVPTGRTRIYEASEVWGDFYDIREYDSNMQNEKYDLDGDGSVNVTDISTIANYILNGDE